MGEMDETMCMHKHLRCPGKWSAARWMDTSPERDPARLPVGSSPFHLGGRYTGGVHGEAVHEGATGRFSDR